MIKLPDFSEAFPTQNNIVNMSKDHKDYERYACARINSINQLNAWNACSKRWKKLLLPILVVAQIPVQDSYVQELIGQIRKSEE